MEKMGKTQDWKQRVKRGSNMDETDEETPERKQCKIEVYYCCLWSK